MDREVALKMLIDHALIEAWRANCGGVEKHRVAVMDLRRGQDSMELYKAAEVIFAITEPLDASRCFIASADTDNRPTTVFSSEQRDMGTELEAYGICVARTRRRFNNSLQFSIPIPP